MQTDRPPGRLADMWDFLHTEWFAALAMGIITALANKLWNRASAKTRKKIGSAIGEASAVITQLVLTAKPGTTIETIIEWGKGAAAIQLARVGVKSSEPLVRALVSEAIANGVKLFVELHPDQKSLAPPILMKLAKLAK